MSRTYKQYPQGYYRKPKGRLRAILGGSRKRAIPPDAWDDERHDKHCYTSCTAARNMHRKGISREMAIRKLKRKFKLTQIQAVRASWGAYRFPGEQYV